MREPDARANHRSGYNCAQSVTAAFAEELGVSRDSAASSAPRPRSEGGKCGAYLAGCQLLSRLKPDAVEAFKGPLPGGKRRRGLRQAAPGGQALQRPGGRRGAAGGGAGGAAALTA